MVKFLFLSLIIFKTFICFSQTIISDTSNIKSIDYLAGEWQGLISNGSVVYEKEKISLSIFLDKNKNYQIRSYTNINGHNIICTVNYTFISNDSIYLIEDKIINSKENTGACLQKMYLRIEHQKDQLTMEGVWKSDTPDCISNGKIVFIKDKSTKRK